MFNKLLESKPRKQKMAGGTVFSVILHSALIGGALYATAHAGIKNERTKAESIKFVEVKKPEPVKPKDEPPPPKKVVIKAPPPKGFQVLHAPVKIDVKIPEIDLSKSVTNPNDFTGKGVKGGTGNGVVGGTGVVDQNTTYYQYQVEKPAEAASGNPPPHYPDVLKSSGVEGEVVAQFVVLETGRADMDTFKVLSSSNDMFSTEVRKVLGRMRFLPAEIAGEKVRQLVQQKFEFRINH